jgi:hypothetical protein
MEDACQMSIPTAHCENSHERQRLNAIKSVLTDEHANRLRKIVDCLQSLLRSLDAKDDTDVTMRREQWLSLLKPVTEEATELQSEIRAGIEA